MILHACSTEASAEARAAGTYRAVALDSEGFIRCSRGDQLAGTVERHHPGVTGLVVLVADPAGLDAVRRRPGHRSVEPRC